MSPQLPNRADVIFAASLDLSPEERESHLIDACGDDAELLAQVRVLLRAHDAAPTGFLDSPAGGMDADGDTDATLAADGSGRTSGKLLTPSETAGPADDEVDPLSLPRAFDESDPNASLPEILTEKAGEVIGSYKLLQQIGEGGFGVVWMAEQSEPIQRKVALKVIKAGMDTKEVLARFDAERQAVALMDHTHIAKVLDAGATPSGRPWFAMELVKGIPITEFCDEQKLGTRERLDLFGDVCAAINHAHQKGVIHRDIKPSNVMVTRDGDKPVVKVIDFGIAKATQSKLTDKTLFTAFEQMIGTPVYMSPEQAGLGQLDIDTRSDIYSLGVLLYELLTGKPPFDGKSLISAGYEEMRRIIREEDPPRPSLRLSTVSGDKDETTRITSALGTEPQKLSRLVRGELDWIVMKAIEKDRSRRYETANAFAADIGRYLNDEPVQAAAPLAAYKFRKFARRNKAAIGTAALITFVLIAATGVSTWQAVEAHRARVQSDKDKEDAEDILSYLIDVFQSPDPARDGRTITVAETLDTAALKLESDLADQPERRSKLQMTLGSTYSALGLYRKAIPLREEVLKITRKELGDEHPDTLSAMGNLANSYSGTGRLDAALKLREEVLALSRKVNGSEHPDTINMMNNLTLSYSDTGRLDEALKLQEEVLALSRKVLGLEHPDRLKMSMNLATSYRDVGRLDEALKLGEEVLALSRKVNGPEHPDTIKSMNNLASLYHDADRQDEALRLREEVLALSRQVLGPEHPDTINTMNNLATSYHEAGHLDEEITLRKVVIELDPEDAETHYNIGVSLLQQGMTKEAIASFRRTIELDPEHAKSHCNLGGALAQQGESEEAIESLRRAIDLGPVDAIVYSNIGFVLFQQGKTNEAIESLRRAIEIDPGNLHAMGNLAAAYGKLGQVDSCGIWIARSALLRGIVDEALLFQQIPLDFSELGIDFPTESPSEQVITGYYDSHKDQFSGTPIHLRIISGAKPAKTRDFMGTLRKELIEGVDFAAATGVLPGDSITLQIDDRGWVERGHLREDLDKAAFALKVGEFSEVIEDNTHFRLLNVVERKDGTPAPLIEVREKVIAALKDEAQTAQIMGWIEQAKTELAAEQKAREEGETKSGDKGDADA